MKTFQEEIANYIAENRNRKKVMQDVCDAANGAVLPIDQLAAWKYLQDAYNLSIDEFIDDQDSLDEETRNKVGLYNWKIREENNEKRNT